jgi:Biopolymer transport protein
VLVTFLLMTAVFSRITILQLDLPSANDGSAGAPPEFRLEVIVRESGFELTNGQQLIAALPKIDGEYDWATLSQLTQQLKSEHPDVDDASVLMERTVKYDYLIQVMDAIRSVDLPVNGEPAAGSIVPTKRTQLFTNIAVGEAP